MNLKLFQEIYELNQAFEPVIEGLKRLEKTSHALPETVRQWRAEVVSIQVETNRGFLDRFETALINDEEWATKFLRKFREHTGDREQIYV